MKTDLKFPKMKNQWGSGKRYNKKNKNEKKLVQFITKFGKTVTFLAKKKGLRKQKRRYRRLE